MKKVGDNIINISEKIKSLQPCDKCQDIQIKKFSPLHEIIDLKKLNKDYMRCECGKRPLDIVMSHILKIMIEDDLVPKKATLRQNSPIPLQNFYYSNSNPQFISKKSLILLHPDFTEDTASRLINEVPETAGILKGNPKTTVGQISKDTPLNHFKILEGDDTQINVMRTLITDKIILKKQQSKHHIEVATTIEDKLIKLHNFCKSNDVQKTIAIDSMCGLGALGIYLLKYGFEKVIFNDINPEMIEALKNNLKINNITKGFEISNCAFEKMKCENVELCMIDAFPGVNIDEIIKKAEKIADKIFII